MRIMIATETYAPLVNGPAVVTRRLAVGLAGRGHEVVVVAPSPGHGGDVDAARAEGQPSIVRVPSIPTPYPRQRCALLTRRGAGSLLIAFGPDVVHVQNHFVLGRALARAARATGVPVVGTNHFVPENMLPHAPGVLLRSAATRWLITRALWRQLARFYERLDAVTFPSRAAAELATRWGMRAAAHVISNGIDVSRFRPPTGAPGPGPGRPVILYVGRLDPDKGLETLVRAMPLVRRRYPADLVLCGTGVAAPALRRLARTSGVAEAVRFTGFVDDECLPDLYRAATLFAMPSANELQSLATLEAMASGLPVVAADALALPELVRPDENGLLAPPGDHRALADRIDRLLSDPAARSRMSAASRATAERHRIESTLHAFERLYRDLTGGLPRRPVADPSTRSSRRLRTAGGG